jgi:hypothetical protein
MGIKLSAKFARQETEAARLARVARRRIPADRAATIRRMLGLPEPPAAPDPAPGTKDKGRARRTP